MSSSGGFRGGNQRQSFPARIPKAEWTLVAANRAVMQPVERETFRMWAAQTRRWQFYSNQQLLFLSYLTAPPPHTHCAEGEREEASVSPPPPHVSAIINSATIAALLVCSAAFVCAYVRARSRTASPSSQRQEAAKWGRVNKCRLVCL